MAGSRLLTVLTFYALTLVWVIPVVFGLRWFWLRRSRRFIVGG